MNVFGDGISWENHVDEVLRDEQAGRVLYHQGDSEFLTEAVKHIATGYEKHCGNALDCGCHVGRWIDSLRRTGLIYNGVDQSEKALSIVRKNRPDAILYHSLLWDMDFKEGFDMCFCIAVLQHNVLTDQTRIVRKIFDALKSGGVFAFTESTLHEPTATQRTHQGWKDMAQVNGFRVVKTFHKNELGLEDMYICIKP